MWEISYVMAVNFDAILRTKKSKIAQTLPPHSSSLTKFWYDPRTCTHSPLIEDCVHVNIKKRSLYLYPQERGKVCWRLRELRDKKYIGRYRVKNKNNP